MNSDDTLLGYWGWVVNQSLAAAKTAHPLLARRADAEAEHIGRVTATALRSAVVPLLAAEPRGTTGLREVLGKH